YGRLGWGWFWVLPKSRTGGSGVASVGLEPATSFGGGAEVGGTFLTRKSQAQGQGVVLQLVNPLANQPSLNQIDPVVIGPRVEAESPGFAAAILVENRLIQFNDQLRGPLARLGRVPAAAALIGQRQPGSLELRPIGSPAGRGRTFRPMATAQEPSPGRQNLPDTHEAQQDRRGGKSGLGGNAQAPPGTALEHDSRPLPRTSGDDAGRCRRAGLAKLSCGNRGGNQLARNRDGQRFARQQQQ